MTHPLPEHQAENPLNQKSTTMTMDFGNIFSCITMGPPHHCYQNLINCDIGMRISNRALVEHMRTQLGVLLTWTHKQRANSFFSIGSTNTDNCDSAFSDRCRNRRNRIFLVHKAYQS